MRFFLPLTTFLSLIFLFNSAHANTRFEIKQMVMREAISQDVPVSLALAVAKVESDFNAKALSAAGARGVMQIMPKTARDEFNVPAKELWDPAINVEIGVQFLKQLHEQYDGRWEFALSHYNGGTIKENRPHSYTRKYVRTVQKWQAIYAEQADLWDNLNTQDIFDDQDDFEVSSLREWRLREDDMDDEYYDEEHIIIIERDERGYWEDRRPPSRHWGPPPPPRHHRRGPPPRRHGGFY